ncbi:hypothetical protein DR999_PMT13845 [Platysternon megacephalum]|uniref:Uncharacterized protein n=1 Tax=Platysternon megacephalum TaxID=55544 RepID=A0A4D9E5L3_9SAUR|nr:hypothetical protein DR999_PMT13845 [Platysternon megacephalum]
MALGGQAGGSGSPGSPREGLRDWIRSACRFAADRNDFRRQDSEHVHGADLINQKVPLLHDLSPEQNHIDHIPYQK